MKKILISALILGVVSLPLVSSALVAPANTNPKKRVTSGELRLMRLKDLSSMSGSTQSGKILPHPSRSGSVTDPKANIELEKNIFRPKDKRLTPNLLEIQEQRVLDKRQRAIVAAFKMLKNMDEKRKIADRERKGEKESPWDYCIRAVKGKYSFVVQWKLTDTKACEKKIISIQKSGERVMENRANSDEEYKKLSLRLKTLCLDDQKATGLASGYCKESLPPSSGSGTTQTGGTITTM